MNNIDTQSTDIIIQGKRVAFDLERKEKFLQALCEGYSLSGAARHAGVGRRTVYDHIAKDPEFASTVKEAIEIGTDLLEDYMLQKAKQPQGFLANMATLKARRPDKWADRTKVDLTQQQQLVIRVEHVTADELIAHDKRLLSEPAIDGEYQIVDT